MTLPPFPVPSRPCPAARLRRLSPLALVLLAACSEPVDFDMRGQLGGFTTAEAAQEATASRPAPDARGVISYPGYQVAVARRGDTVQAMAARLGLPAAEVARFNGIEQDAPLRLGEIIALPERVGETAPIATAAAPGGVDIESVAGGAIARSPTTAPGVTTTALPPATATTAATAPATPAAAPAPRPGPEPVRHKVVRGETAYTIARLYDVPVRSLAEWNGLGPDFAIREGQFLLIPVAGTARPPAAQPSPAPQATPVARPAPAVTPPGQGSPTPTPPSASQPLPDDEVAADTPPPAAPVELDAPTRPASGGGELAYPVTGSIIRDYEKGRNDGIDIAAAPGTAVGAAEAGTVAAITSDADGIPIIVVRHPDNLLTVYANVTDIEVEKDDQVSRGQTIARLRGGDEAYLHFEVRRGFDSVDPTPYLN